MKINKKIVIAVALIASMLLVSCSNDKKENKKKHKKDKEQVETIDENELYTTDDIINKTGASELNASWYYSEDCYVVKSLNKYNNVRFLVFDSQDEAQSFYNEAIEKYLYNHDYSDSKYSIGLEEGVCDASILDMILVDKNIVLVAEIEIWGEMAVNPDVEEDYPSAVIYLNDKEISQIVEEWSSESSVASKPEKPANEGMTELTFEQQGITSIDLRDNETDDAIRINFERKTMVINDESYNLTDEQNQEILEYMTEFSIAVKAKDYDYWPHTDEYPDMFILFEYKVNHQKWDGAMCYPDNWTEMIDYLKSQVN